MTSIRRLASVLCLVTFCSYSNAQVNTSGELIDNGNWSGCYTPTQSGFWGGTSGGPCPGNNGSQIIFSYGQNTLTQTVDLPTVLPNSGTGLQVNGYNWHWHVKNSNINGSQPGSYDPIAYIDVTLYNTDGTIAVKDTYDYGYHIPNWIVPSGTRTYAQPYSLQQVDTLTLSVTGKDSGNWAGYYGPEFLHFSLTVNYSVDPCYDNPLWSSSCPGYLEAFQALMAQATPEDATEDYSLTSIASPSFSAMPEESTTGEVVVDVGGVELSTTGEMSVPDGIPQEVKEKKPVDMNLIMSIVREATDDSKALAVVNQSIEQSMDENANPDFSMTNETLASIDKQRETSIEQSMGEDANPDFSMTNETLASIDKQRETSIEQSILENQEITESSNALSITHSVVESTASIQSFEENSIEAVDTNSTSISSLSEFSTSTPIVTESTNTENKQTVKKNVKDNDAAGGVSIDSLVQTPVGFESYLGMQLSDVNFYEPKEIYRGQRNVDNAKVLRGLGTDKLHQQMVEEQYRR